MRSESFSPCYVQTCHSDDFLVVWKVEFHLFFLRYTQHTRGWWNASAFPSAEYHSDFDKLGHDVTDTYGDFHWESGGDGGDDNRSLPLCIISRNRHERERKSWLHAGRVVTKAWMLIRHSSGEKKKNWNKFWQQQKKITFCLSCAASRVTSRRHTYVSSTRVLISPEAQRDSRTELKPAVEFPYHAWFFSILLK